MTWLETKKSADELHAWLVEQARKELKIKNAVSYSIVTACAIALVPSIGILGFAVKTLLGL